MFSHEQEVQCCIICNVALNTFHAAADDDDDDFEATGSSLIKI